MLRLLVSVEVTKHSIRQSLKSEVQFQFLHLCFWRCFLQHILGGSNRWFKGVGPCHYRETQVEFQAPGSWPLAVADIWGSEPAHRKSLSLLDENKSFKK